MQTIFAIFGLPALVILLISVAILPFRAEGPDQWAVAGISAGIGSVGTVFALLLFGAPGGLFSALGMLFVAGVIPTFAMAHLLYVTWLDARIFLAGEEIVTVDELPPAVRQAIRPYVQNRWITESELQRKLTQARGVLGQMAAAAKDHTDFMKEEALQKRLAAQERLFERMREEERGLFAAQLAAEADAKLRATTELGRLERHRDQLLQTVAGLRDREEELSAAAHAAQKQAAAVAREAEERHAADRKRIRTLSREVEGLRQQCPRPAASSGTDTAAPKQRSKSAPAAKAPRRRSTSGTGQPKGSPQRKEKRDEQRQREGSKEHMD